MAEMERNGVPSLEELTVLPALLDPGARAEISRMAAEIDSELTIERLRASIPDYDVDMKYINCDIYNSHLACWMGTCFAKMQRLQMDRMMSLIGLPDRKACMEWLGEHSERDATVGELLVSEALVTDKWKELPDELQDEYHARKKGHI